MDEEKMTHIITALSIGITTLLTAVATLLRTIKNGKDCSEDHVEAKDKLATLQDTLARHSDSIRILASKVEAEKKA